MGYPKSVYAIRHNVTKRIYVGSSAHPANRYKQHLNLLRCGKHGVEDMQKDFDEYGEDYTFFVLEKIDFAHKEREYEWMWFFDSYTRGVGYNYKDHHKRLGAEQ